MQLLKTSITMPLEFVSAGHFVTDELWTHSQRTIDSFELIIGVKGTLYMQQDDEKYEVRPGDVLLLLPNRIHQGFAASGKDTSFYWIHFLCPDASHIADEEFHEEMYMLQTNPESHRINTAIYIPLFSTPSGIERLNILFHQLLHIAYSDYSSRYAAGYMATSLLLELSEQTISGLRTTIEQTPTDKNLANILEWVRIHAIEPISVTTLANRFNYNKDYLSRFFKRKTGMNLQEYIHALKLSKAKDLLVHTRQSIKEIAYAVGIADEKYFMRLFKKYEKITPTEFRKAYYMTHLNKQ
ncbi:helix-turn-helix domain-containing protein [Paenibacillus sp. PL91]|uniref:helix-turn-helix domain-containing protein n=1 Tax=Paenibacillus sp. PL91 TaxID=2729538 RepID=UPI00145CE038|nr:AraC family transcriptional regulator [Paenibacillus sp. PL91]MBC9203702.1 AraC family transcriptional regulator [Paenibacillus sp. PL91]